MRSAPVLLALLGTLVALTVTTTADPIENAQASGAGRSAHQLVRDFTCIHRYEGAWNARTGNGYYGGLQMDLTFQRTYGAEFLAAFGTADRWTPGMQIAVAMRAYLRGRGFYPWPNTARMCGLL